MKTLSILLIIIKNMILHVIFRVGHHCELRI
ncbi:hypothetical protein PHDIMM138B_13730 [Phytobacter diazotrophicus]